MHRLLCISLLLPEQLLILYASRCISFQSPDLHLKFCKLILEFIQDAGILGFLLEQTVVLRQLGKDFISLLFIEVVWEVIREEYIVYRTHLV